MDTEHKEATEKSRYFDFHFYAKFLTEFRFQKLKFELSFPSTLPSDAAVTLEREC